MEVSQTTLIAIAGVLIIGATLIASLLGRTRVPSLVGFILLGFGVRLLNRELPLLSDQSIVVFDFLANLGIICLLFRVGLESHIAQLVRQLSRAGVVWIADIVVSGSLGFLVGRVLLDLTLIQSLFVAVALTATSVGVTVLIWKEAGALDSPTGALLVDVAELDDVSGVALMALLIASAPAIRSGAGGALVSTAGATLGVFLLKAVGFAALCYGFAHYAERRVTAFLRRYMDAVGLALVVAGIGLMIAALTEWLGFSFAIGAFFAGLVFSRDPDRFRIDTSFKSIHDFLVPFFFIHIGLSVDPGVLGGALAPAAVILMAAVIGKLAGPGLASIPVVGLWGGLAIGTSMGVRAEIAMLVMDRGRRLGDWAVTPGLFNAAVLAALTTCIALPIVTRLVLMSRQGKAAVQ